MGGENDVPSCELIIRVKLTFAIRFFISGIAVALPTYVGISYVSATYVVMPWPVKGHWSIQAFNVSPMALQAPNKTAKKTAATKLGLQKFDFVLHSNNN